MLELHATIPKSDVRSAVGGQETDFAVLHALRLKGLAGTELLASIIDVPLDLIDDAVGRLAKQGFVEHREAGRFVGWTLTATGREQHGAELATRRSDVVGHLAPIYESFLAVNGGMKELCARWQSLATEDKPGRWEAVEELAAIDEQAQPTLRDAGRIVGRFDTYGTRLHAALERLQEGDERFFTGVTVDSYHTVWFECHEDFLLMTGRDRVAEGSF